MAAISRLVAIGPPDEDFREVHAISLGLLSDHGRPVRATIAAAVAGLLIPDLHFGPRLQTKLAFGHHGFPAFEPLVDHHVLIDARTRLDRHAPYTVRSSPTTYT